MVLDNTEVILNEIISYLKKGYDKNYISKELKITDEELIEIACARLKGKEKFKDAGKLFMTLNDLRFATSEEIADYRAKRLKCDTIVDLCSGIGSQSIAFSKQCKKVYSIEIDPRKIEYAKKNAALYGIKNIEFVCADVLDFDLKKADIIFCDPERLPAETERKLENIKIVSDIIKKYSKITKNICIEVPPQISPDKIDFDCGKEYISVEGELNRLNLYFGDLKKNDISVVSLPSYERLVSSDKAPKVKDKKENLKYIYDVDKAVLKSGLINELVSTLGAEAFVFNRLKKNLFLTSSKKISNPFLQRFEVVKSMIYFEEKIIETLRDLNAKEVVLRGNISEGSYWGLRKSFENKLNGQERFHLFIFGNDVLICRKE